MFMKNKEINEIKCAHFLRVVIDNYLTWEAHINETCNKITSTLFIITRLHKITELLVMRTVCYGIVHLFLSHEITVWGHTTKEGKSY
jgi:hypothetical protein